ncbi:hypothetical protein ElyMa_005189100 [Elysia marginata]|uniref:BESS domain-containing protein n=1 Tax=Elysia marginata TaxID=1093978 RepID=A0AAV4JXG9_9GAST|nr:hypothetical protein ElyMa_005189100 [Elysia marginata]
MSFLESFAKCSHTHTNFAKSGTSDIELESTPSPYLEDSQNQLTQEDRDTSCGQEVGNVAATDALSPPPPPLPSRKRKKPDSNSFDLQILAALKESENNDDPDVHFSFWNELQPMLKQLNSLEASKFKHKVHGLLISYIERLQSKSSHVSTVHPSSFLDTHSYRTIIQPSPIPSPSPTHSSLVSHAEYEQDAPPRTAYHEEQYYQF